MCKYWGINDSAVRQCALNVSISVVLYIHDINAVFVHLYLNLSFLLVRMTQSKTRPYMAGPSDVLEMNGLHLLLLYICLRGLFFILIGQALGGCIAKYPTTFLTRPRFAVYQYLSIFVCKKAFKVGHYW